jgi:hypothetical protein
MAAALRFTLLSVALAYDARDLKDLALDLLEALSLGFFTITEVFAGTGRCVRRVSIYYSTEKTLDAHAQAGGSRMYSVLSGLLPHCDL